MTMSRTVKAKERQKERLERARKGLEYIDSISTKELTPDGTLIRTWPFESKDGIKVIRHAREKDNSWELSDEVQNPELVQRLVQESDPSAYRQSEIAMRDIKKATSKMNQLRYKFSATQIRSAYKFHYHTYDKHSCYKELTASLKGLSSAIRLFDKFISEQGSLL